MVGDDDISLLKYDPQGRSVCIGGIAFIWMAVCATAGINRAIISAGGQQAARKCLQIIRSTSSTSSSGDKGNDRKLNWFKSRWKWFPWAIQAIN